MKHTIPCKSCNGTGRATLTRPYQDTLDAWPKGEKYASCADLRHNLIKAGKLDSSHTESLESIVHKRMKIMMENGVVRRVKQVTPEKNGRKVRLHRAWVFERV